MRRMVAALGIFAIAGCAAQPAAPPPPSSPAPVISDRAPAAPMTSSTTRTWSPGSDDPFFFTLHDSLQIQGDGSALTVADEPQLRRLIYDLERVDSAWKAH